MPQVALGAIASGVLAASTALPWLAGAAFMQSFLGSIVLGGISHALSPKPKKPNAPAIEPVSSNTFAVRQPATTRKYAYGLTRMTDVYAHMTTVGEDDNSKLHAFLVISNNEWDEMLEIWVNDYIIPTDWLDADGNVTQGRYANKLRVRIHLGSPNQVADSVAILEIPEWTSDHRGRGICWAFITMTKDRDVYTTGMPNFSFVGRAAKLQDPRTSVSSFSGNIELMAYNYHALQEHGFRANPDTIDLTNIASEANICDEIVDTVALDKVVSSISGNIFTVAGTQLNFQNGDRIRIIAPGSPPGGTATGTDYYVIVRQTTDTPRLMIASSLANCMNAIPVTISSPGSGTITLRRTGEPRYHGAGIMDSADTLGDNLTDLLNSMAGRLINSGGKWRFLAGAWREPDTTLDLGDLRDGFEFKRPVSMSEKFNVIAGKYISSDNSFQPADFPSIKYQQFIDQDGGIEYPPRQLHLPYTDRVTTAQRIGKIEMFRSRQDIVFTSSFSMANMELQPGDTTNVNIPEFMGWEDKIFEVTQAGFILNEVFMVEYGLRETSETIYDWSQGEAVEFDPAPNTTLPNPFDVQIPTGVAFLSRAIETVEGDVVYSLGMQWDPHPNAFVTDRGQFEIQFKTTYYPVGHEHEGDPTGELDWRPSFFVDGQRTFSDVLNSSVNIQYDLRIRAINSLGRRSNWVTIPGAVAGSSGGVGTTENWGGVSESVGLSLDWGSVADAPDSAAEDWGSVV